MKKEMIVCDMCNKKAKYTSCVMCKKDLCITCRRPLPHVLGESVYIPSCSPCWKKTRKEIYDIGLHKFWESFDFQTLENSLVNYIKGRIVMEKI